MGLLLAHRPRLFHGALRTANDVLLLQRLNPETRRKIRQVRDQGDEWPSRVHGRPSLRDLSIEVGNDRNQQVRRVLTKILG